MAGTAEAKVNSRNKGAILLASSLPSSGLKHGIKVGFITKLHGERHFLCVPPLSNVDRLDKPIYSTVQLSSAYITDTDVTIGVALIGGKLSGERWRESFDKG